MSNAPDERLAPPHDSFQAPDAEPDADTRERALADETAAGDGDEDDVRRVLGLPPGDDR